MRHNQCGSGGTGRHAILRGWWGNPWGFKSPLPHHSPNSLPPLSICNLQPAIRTRSILHPRRVDGLQGENCEEAQHQCAQHPIQEDRCNDGEDCIAAQRNCQPLVDRSHEFSERAHGLARKKRAGGIPPPVTEIALPGCAIRQFQPVLFLCSFRVPELVPG